MQKLNIVDTVALVLVIVGGVNWGLMGLFNFDAVAAVLVAGSLLSRLVYVLVGAAAVYLAVILTKLERR